MHPAMNDSFFFYVEVTAVVELPPPFSGSNTHQEFNKLNLSILIDTPFSVWRKYAW